MSILIEDIRVNNSLFGTGGDVAYLQGNVFERVDIEIDFRIENFAQATIDEDIEFAPLSQLTTDYIEDLSGAARFSEFYIGDTIQVTSANTPANNGTYTIISKPSNALIKISSTLTNDVDTVALVKNITTVAGITFKSAFIENNEGTNFDSKVDGSEQRWTQDSLSSISTSLLNMTPLGALDWQSGGTTYQIKGQGLIGVEAFTIVIQDYISPFFLAGQLNDLQNDIAPTYFLSAACLKHAFRIELQPDLNDPNRTYTTTVADRLGNTGWLDENFNGFPTNYFIDSIAYERVSDSATLTEIQLSETEETLVTISLKNTVDSPFIDAAVDKPNATDIVVDFAYLPQDQTLYQNTGDLMRDNFAHDWAFNQAGEGTLMDGIRFGTDYQVIKDYSIAFVSASEVTITFTCDFGADSFAKCNQTTARNYILTVNVQDSFLATAGSDRVQLAADVNEFFFDESNPDVMVFDNRFLIHPQNDIDDLQEEDCFLPQDLVVNRTLLCFDNSGGEVLTNVLGELIAEKTDGSEFVLETYSQAVPATPIVNGGQFFNISQAKSFKIPSGQIRSNCILSRRTDLDSGALKTYLLQYPFAFRWEDWVALANVNSDFYDAAELNDGFNHDWWRYNDPAAWQIKWRVTTTINDSGTIYTRQAEFNLDSRDYDSNPDFGVNDVKTFETVPPFAQLISGSDEFVLGYQDVKVEVDWEYTGATVPDLADAWAVVMMEVYQQGGRYGITQLSTEYDTDGNSFLKGLTTLPLRVTLTKPTSTTFKAECLVDRTKLPANVECFNISGRIGFRTDPLCIDAEGGGSIFPEGGAECLQIEN